VTRIWGLRIGPGFRVRTETWTEPWTKRCTLSDGWRRRAAGAGDGIVELRGVSRSRGGRRGFEGFWSILMDLVAGLVQRAWLINKANISAYNMCIKKSGGCIKPGFKAHRICTQQICAIGGYVIIVRHLEVGELPISRWDGYGDLSRASKPNVQNQDAST
jgi:hypothetical protein